MDCMAAHNCLERNLRRASRRLQNPLDDGRQKFVSRRNESVNPLPQQSPESAGREFLATLLHDPKKMAAEIEGILLANKKDSSTFASADIHYYTANMSELFHTMFCGVQGVRSESPQTILNVLILQASKYGSMILRVLREVVPTPTEGTVRRAIRKRCRDSRVVNPGINVGFLDDLQETDEIFMPMDGTRVLRVAEAIPHSGVVCGPAFPADVAQWTDSPCIYRDSPATVEEFVVSARAANAFASEAYVACIQRGRQLLPYLVMPQPKQQFSGANMVDLQIKLVCDLLGRHPRIGFFGFSTDADSRSQSAVRTLSQPPAALVRKCRSKVLKPCHWSLSMVSLVMGPNAVLLHFADENHVTRCVVRNMSNPLQLLRLYPARSRGRGIDKTAGLCHIALLRLLKYDGYLEHIKEQDIAAAVKMNVDGAPRILSQETIDVVRSWGSQFEGLAFVMSAVFCLLRPYRHGPRKPASEVIRGLMQGITMIRTWRMSLLKFKMKLSAGRGSRSCGSFLSAATYYSLEELAQQGVLFLMFLCCSKRCILQELHVSLAQFNTLLVEFLFGDKRSTNRQSGEKFTIAQLCHELSVSVIGQEARQRAEAAGARLNATRKRQSMYGPDTRSRAELQSYEIIQSEPEIVPTFQDIARQIHQAVDEGVLDGVRECWKIPAWQELYVTEGCMLSSLQQKYILCLTKMSPIVDYEEELVISSLEYFSDIDARAVVQALWTNRSEFRRHGADLGNTSEIADIEEDADADADPGVGAEEPDGPHQSAAMLRSFIRESAQSDLLSESRLSWNDWQRLLRQANCFREWTSRDRQSRFIAGGMPGNSNVQGNSRLDVFDICIFKTSTDVAFVGVVAAIHRGREDVRAVDMTSELVWLCVVQLALTSENYLVHSPDECIISCFDAGRHVETILKENVHYQKMQPSGKDMIATAELLSLIPAEVLAARIPGDIFTCWAIPRLPDSEAGRTGNGTPAVVPAMEQQLQQLTDEEPTIERILAVKIDGGTRSYKVQWSDGARTMERDTDLDPDIVDDFLKTAVRRKRTRSTRVADPNFDYDDPT